MKCPGRIWIAGIISIGIPVHMHALSTYEYNTF